MTDAANDSDIHKDPFGPTTAACKHHLDAMKSAVQGHGLWHRVSKTPEHLAARHARFDPYDVDPLELLHNMVMGKARHMAALNGVGPSEIEARCPICFFAVGGWIDEAAVSMVVRLATMDEQRLADQVRNAQLEADARSL